MGLGERRKSEIDGKWLVYKRILKKKPLKFLVILTVIQNKNYIISWGFSICRCFIAIKGLTLLAFTVVILLHVKR